MDYNYVASSSSSPHRDKIVFSHLKSFGINQNSINGLIRHGNDIRIYTEIDEDKARKKLSRFSRVSLVSEKIKGEEYQTITAAIEGRKGQLLNNTQKAVNVGMSVAQSSNVFFSLAKLKSEALKADTSMTLQQVDKKIEERIKQKEIIVLDTVSGIGNNIGISKTAYEQEKQIQTTIAKGVNGVLPLLTKTQINQLELTHLTRGQQQATTHILTTKDRFIGIQGTAGVGKTTQLKAVMNALEKYRPDIEVIGLTPTHKAVSELKSIGINAQTISAFLVERQQDKKTNEKLAFNNKLFVMDEASMIGNKNTAILYKLINEQGGRGVYSGDSKQLLSIDPGASFSFQQQYTELKFSVMSEIIRQNKRLKPAVNVILNNNIKESLQVIDAINPSIVKRSRPFETLANVVDRKMLKSHKYNNEIEYIAKDYASRTPHDRENTLIITRLNTDKEAINQEIHQQLIAQGELDKTEEIMTVFKPVSLNKNQLHSIAAYDKDKILSLNKQYFAIEKINKSAGTLLIKEMTTQEKSHLIPKNIAKHQNIALYEEKEIRLSPGDKIIFNKTIQDKGFTANSEWKVKSINNSELTLIDRNKKEKIIDVNQPDEKHFTLGYARTDYSAQGASCEHVILFERSDKYLASARSHYVGVSRAKSHVTVVTDDTDKFIKNAGKISDSITATELLREKSVNRTEDSVTEAATKTLQQVSTAQINDLLSAEKECQTKADNFIATMQKNTRQTENYKEQTSVSQDVPFQREKTL